jgi:hypothetical protein
LLLPGLIASAAPPARVRAVARGQGSVEPASGSHAIGTRITFTARAEAGFVFRDWTNESGAPLAPGQVGRQLEYMALGDATVVANFVRTPFAEAAGNWTAWLRRFDFDAQGRPITEAHGIVDLALRRSGAFTGSLVFDSERFVLSGTFDAAGRAAISLPRAGRSALRVELRIELERPRDQLSLAVFDGETCAMSSVSRLDPSRLAARYTATIGVASDPGAKGFALLKRTRSGSIRGVGSMADGNAFAFSSRAGTDHFLGATALPVHAVLTNGTLSGVIVLQSPTGPANAISGKLQRLAANAQAGGAAGGAADGPRKTVFVGPRGDDANGGTVKSPLATLDAALTRIGGAGEIVMLPGNYERASLNLATANRVTLRSAPGHTASVFFGEKIAGSAFSHHSGNVWKATVQSTVPAQGTENRFWIYEVGTREAPIASDAVQPLQRRRTMRLDHFRLAQAPSIEAVDLANGRYFISEGVLYLRTSTGEAPRANQEFRIPSRGTAESLVHDGSAQCDVTLDGIEIYFGFNGADFSGVNSYRTIGCKFVGAGNSGILAGGVRYGIEQRCEYASNTNDGCSPVNNTGTWQSLITVLDGWSHDNGDEGHSLHGRCQAYYFGGLYEFNANGGLTPAIGASAVIHGLLTRGNIAGISPAVIPAVHVLVSDWASRGDLDGLAQSTNGLATVVDSRILNPLRYSFIGVAGDARAAIHRTELVGGQGRAAGAGGPNFTFRDDPLDMERIPNAPRAVPVNANGSTFAAPRPGQRIAPFSVRTPNAQVSVRAGSGVQGVQLAESLLVDAANRVTVIGPNPQKLTLAIDANTGRFSGTFLDLARPALTRNIEGVIVQSDNEGVGFSLDGSTSAAVRIAIP